MKKYTEGTPTIDTTRVTRIEVIDQNGRSYFHYERNNVVEIQLQDDCRTLKVFISTKQEDKE